MSAEGLTGVLGQASPCFLRWPHLTDPHAYAVDINLVPPVSVGAGVFEWSSDSFDVSGLPDMSLQIETDPSALGEMSLNLHIEVSLDGKGWARIPDEDFYPNLSTVTVDLSNPLVYVNLFSKTHFIRLVLSTMTSAPYPSTTITALITAGEV